MKIVVLDGYTLNPGDLSWKGLERLGNLIVYDRTTFDRSGESLIVERAKEAEALFTNKTPISREVLAQLPHLRYIGVLATGYNVVDIEAAQEKGVVVTNIPAYGTDSVGQMTIALLLEMCNHVGVHSESVKRGEWTNNADWCYWSTPMIELTGKTMGIIGYGKIGQATGRIAQALGMKVIAYNHRPRKELENEIMKYADLDIVFANSDVISLHCPLNEETKGIINKQTIAKMKDGVMLINTSRGPLIVEEDLAEALNLGKVRGAALDVVSNEPIRADNPLLTAKNCYITPHIAWAAVETRQRLMGIAVDNFEKFLTGQPVNVIKH
ncbi:D-2-hydroxyacid dehydrogenase [Desulfitobacterium sp.]|uniref:D-2-hydroxyacid dehydrogenase n=1 Tax=Desulfitobacterium sp. TaxID=49981 RepID=UPI002B21DA3E|nr:D-2-hydroxyacid dehydrogenase [Desulfitobacterium sp.]MEA4901344.1 D-2-hydroxyacid dehydrogenase [Desulfitobacterium sp.]